MSFTKVFIDNTITDSSKIMQMLLKQKSTYFNQKINFLHVFLLLFISILGILNYSNVIQAAPNNIPIGCPGTLISGPPTAEQRSVCDNIPLGCPGSTKQGQPPAGFDKSTCPYGDGTDDSSKNPPPEDPKDDPIEKAKFDKCGSVQDCGITEKFIDPAIKLLTGAVGLIVTIMIIVAGIQYSSAGSDPQKVASAKSKVTNAIIALVTYIFLFGLLQWLWPGGLI